MTAAGSWLRHPAWAAAVAAILVAMLGAAATDLGPWYQGLRQPSWKPPDVLFGPAWTLIYALWALAAVLAWKGAESQTSRRRIVWAFAVNGSLNVLWSLLFFRAQRPDWALIEVVVFWLSIVALIFLVTPHSRAAGWLLIPYLLWVSFAGVLNYAVVQLNGPF